MAEQIRIVNQRRTHFTIDQVTIRPKGSVVMSMNMTQDIVDALAAQQVEVYYATASGSFASWRARTLDERATVTDTRVAVVASPKAVPAAPAPVAATPAVEPTPAPVQVEPQPEPEVAEAPTAEPELETETQPEPPTDEVVDEVWEARASELRALHGNTVKKIARKLGLDTDLKGEALVQAVIAAEKGA